MTFLSYGPSSPPTPKSYRALHNLSCTVFAHTAFSASLHRPLSSRQAYSPLHKPVSRCRGLQQRSGDSQVAVPTRIYIYIYRHVCVGRTGRPTVIGVAAAHICRCKVNICSCIYSVLAAATNTPYSDNTVFASAYVGGSLPSVFTQLWESRVVSAKGMFAAVVLQLQVFAAASQELWHRLTVTASRQILF